MELGSQRHLVGHEAPYRGLDGAFLYGDRGQFVPPGHGPGVEFPASHGAWDFVDWGVIELFAEFAQIV